MDTNLAYQTSRQVPAPSPQRPSAAENHMVSEAALQALEVARAV